MFEKLNIIPTLFTALLLLVSSCIREDVGTPEIIIEEPEETEVAFSMQLPGNYAPSAGRALDDNDEYEVRTVEVLLFAPGGALKYTAYADDITVNDARTRSFSITMRTGTYDMIVLANSREWIKTSFGQDYIPEGTTAAAVRQGLIATSSSTNGWNTNNTSSDYKTIPMFGERKNAVITHNTSFTGSANRIVLSRMLARIDVVVNPDIQSKFKLKEIFLYNPYDKGLIIPADETTVWDPAANQALLPSLVPGWTSTGSYQRYAVNSAGTACQGEIYAFEAPAGTLEDFLKNTCLILAADYEGSQTFYRVDFFKTVNNVQVHMPLLRNHKYTVTINGVNVRGANSLQDAYEDLAANLDMGISVRDDGEIGNYVTDGNFYLGASREEFDFWRPQANNNKLMVSTNFPTGWSAELSATSSPGGGSVTWITLGTRTDNGTGATDELLFNVSFNLTSFPRTAYIILTAGTLTIPVKITQSTQQISSVVVEPTEFIIPEGDIRTVTFQGTIGNLKIRAIDPERGTILSEGETSSVSGGTGGTYTIPAMPSDIPQRMVSYEYFYEPDKDWVSIRMDIQYNYTYKIEVLDRNSGDPFNGNGDTVRLRLTGYTPALMFRASTTSSGTTALGTTFSVPMGLYTDDEPYEVVIPILRNDGNAERNIWIVYGQTVSSWKQIISESQPLSLYIFESTGRVLGRAHVVAPLSWVQAMGLDASYSSTALYSSAGQSGDPINRFYNIGAATGCGSFSETGYPAGLWRLWTVDEFMEATQVPGMIMIGYFWTSKEYNASNGIRGYNSSNNGVSTTTLSKSNNASIGARCVRENREPEYTVTTTHTDNVPSSGATVSITAEGYYPTLAVRVASISGSTATALVSGSLYGQNGSSSVSLKIPVNTSTTADLNIEIQYNDGTSWNTIWSGIQYNLRKLPSGRILAQSDARLNGPTSGATSMTWAQGMGINTEYNTKYFYSSGYSTGEEDNDGYTHGHAKSVATGCGAYWEVSSTDEESGVGKWFMPTRQEGFEIRTLGKAYSSLGIVASRKYWTSTEYYFSSTNGTYAWMDIFNNTSNTSVGTVTKSTAQFIRCVRY